jgi:hypothetical protein
LTTVLHLKVVGGDWVLEPAFRLNKEARRLSVELGSTVNSRTFDLRLQAWFARASPECQRLVDGLRNVGLHCRRGKNLTSEL